MGVRFGDYEERTGMTRCHTGVDQGEMDFERDGVNRVPEVHRETCQDGSKLQALRRSGCRERLACWESRWTPSPLSTSHQLQLDIKTMRERWTSIIRSNETLEIMPLSAGFKAFMRLLSSQHINSVQNRFTDSHE